MRDSLFDDTAVRVSLPMLARTDGTVDGDPADVTADGQFFRTAMLVVFCGDITDGTHTVTLQHSDSVSSGWSDVDDDHLQGSLAPMDPPWAHSVQRLGYLGGKRFLRARVVTDSATTGGSLAGLLLLSAGSGAPIT